MTVDEDKKSVHLHHQNDAEFQNDACITTEEINTTFMSHKNISQQQKHLSLIRLESGRQIWWLDNGISSHRAEVMLRRRMRYLQEEQTQHEVLGDSDYNEISAVHGADAESQQNGYEDVGQRNNIISTAACDDSRDMTTTDEPIITAVQTSKVTNTALPKENDEKSDKHVANGHNSINAINEVSLESIDDEQTILSHQLPPRSTQQLLQYCHESNIPVVTVGTTLSMCKKTWIDFGEDNVNVVGAMSNRQFLICNVSSESTALDALDTTSSAMLVVDDNSSNINSDESLIDVTLERISTKGGFICMLHDNSSSTQCTGNNHGESASDPIRFQLKNGETQMIHVAWNPTQEGCVRDNIGLRITLGAGQVRHEIVLVGSARESDKTSDAVDSSIGMAKLNEWNGVSAEYSEIREDGSQFDMVVDEVGLTITEESIECSSTATNGDETNVLIDSHEVHEIAQMMQKASISPKKASMAAKSLSQLPEARSEEAVNRRHVYADQIMTAQEDVDSERIFAEETGLIPETSQDFVNGLYMNDKVRHLLDDFDAESTSTDDRRSGRSTPTFGSFSSEEEKFIVSDVSQRLYDEKQLKPQVKTAEEEMTAEKTEAGNANVVPIQSTSESRRFSTTTSYHYGKVTDQLNAMMEEDVSCDSNSQSKNDSESSLSSEECDQSRDGKVGIFNFDKTMSNEENEELNMLPETSIDHSSDWDSSGTDMSIDSNLRRNQYKQIGSDLGDLMDQLSELEQFTQMQQDYLTSPTTHDFRTQLENINEQIDNNLTPSSGNATNSRTPAKNMSANRPVLKVKETREPKTVNQPPTPKDSAQKCYFYKPPQKENNSSALSASRDRIDQKKEPYKSPFAAVLEAETSFQSIDSMLDDFSSCDGSVCVDKSELGELNSSDDVLLDSSSFDESFSSKATEFDVSNHSSDLDDDTSTSMSEASSTVLLQNKETNVATSEQPLHETRSEQIASIKSKLSSWKANANDQLPKPVVSRAPQYSSPTKIPQPPSTQNLQLKTPAVKSLAISSLETSVKSRQFSSPTKIPRLTPSSQKLQLKTPALKTLDVASLTASASTSQKSARMTYGNFSQLSHTENSPSDNDVEGMSRLPKMTKSVKTPTPLSRRAPTQLKTPSSISAYEKHVERMRRSRNSFS